MTYGEEEELLLEVMDEIYESFLISAVLAEAIPLSASEFWNNKDDYFRHSFEKPPKGWIDGGQDRPSDGAKDLQTNRSRKRF